MLGKKGFTLVELLVVIAVLLVVIAFLVPVVITVEDRAALVTCQASLKQLGNAFHMYAADQHGNFPLTWGGGGMQTTRADQWEGAIYSYFGVKSTRDPEFLELVYCPSKGDYYRWRGYYYSTSYFDFMWSGSPGRPLNLSVTPAQYWVLGDFCWGDPASRWMSGQMDRYAMVDKNNPTYRLKTSHADAKRNVLHADNSVFVHSLYTNTYDKWPQ